jgi:hypothetical protein
VGRHPNEAATAAHTCLFPKLPEADLPKQQAFWTQQQQKQQINNRNAATRATQIREIHTIENQTMQDLANKK